MYEECLDVFNSMSYGEHALDAGRANFDKNYTILSERFNTWQSDMKVKYGNNDPNSEFSKKMDVFMNQVFTQYAALSPKQGDADIQWRPHFRLDSPESHIYFMFFEMMQASPWRLHLYNSVNDMAEWKLNMKWMGKRLFCIAYYNDPLHLQHYKQIQEFLADANCQVLWDVGAPTWAIVTSLTARSKPFNDPNDTPFQGLTGLLRGLHTYS